MRACRRLCGRILPRSLRRLARDGQGEGRTSTPRYSPTTTSKPSAPKMLDLAWPGRDEQLDRATPQQRSTWSRRAGLARSGPLRDRRGASPCSTMRSTLESDPAGSRRALWQSIGHANTAQVRRPAVLDWRCRTAIELGGPPAELYTELALQSVRRRGMWVEQQDPELVAEWVKRALELSPEGSPTHPRRSPRWRCERGTRILHARSRPQPSGSATTSFAPTRSRLSRRWRGDLATSTRLATPSTSASGCSPRSPSPRQPFCTHAGCRCQSRPAQAVRGRKPELAAHRDGRRVDRPPPHAGSPGAASGGSASRPLGRWSGR